MVIGSSLRHQPKLEEKNKVKTKENMLEPGNERWLF
jgi:hypothetical protein